MNKVDEVSLNLEKYNPDIAMFTESWLDDSIPDHAVAFPKYQVIRNDRNRHGGGIISYIHECLPVSVLSFNEIPSLQSCSSEIMPMILPNMLFIAIYHSFWNSPAHHQQAISCIEDIVDYALAQRFDASKARIVISGDFNELHLYYDEIAKLTRTKACLLYTSPSPRDLSTSRMPSSA